MAPKYIEHGATFEQLMALDAELVRGGMLPLSNWWKSTLARWYRHPSARSLVARVGRAGIKSHSASKCALAEVLCGTWHVPIGERHFFIFVSISKNEASQRLLLLESMLRILGAPFDRVGDEIQLRDKRLGFKVCACDVGAVSGYRAIGFVCDELAKWHSEGSDPAVEVIASARAMCASHSAAARSLLISSPFGTLDEHCRRFELGDTREQLIAYAPTWVSNNSLTKRQTQLLEIDPKVWAREYLAEPGSVVDSIFAKADIRAAFGLPTPEEWGPSWCSTDPSSLMGDGYGTMIGKEVGGVVCVTHIYEYGTLDFARMTLGDITADIAKRAKEAGCSCVLGDQRESAGISVLFEQAGIAYQSVVWTNASIHGGVLLLRRLMKDRKLAICADDALKNEMTRAKQHLLPTGTVRYQLSGLDRLSCLVTWSILRQNTVSLGDGEDKLSRMLRQSIERGEVNRPPDCDYQESTPSLYSYRTL